MTISRQWRLAARPVGEIKTGDFELVNVPIPEPADGQIVVAVTHISIDPRHARLDERGAFLYPADGNR